MYKNSIWLRKKPPTLLFSKPLRWSATEKSYLFFTPISIRFHIELPLSMCANEWSLFAQIENKKKIEIKLFAISKQEEKRKGNPEERWTEKRRRFNRFNRPLFIFIAFAINSINKNPRRKSWKRQELSFRLVRCFLSASSDWNKTYFHHALFSQWLKNFFRSFFSIIRHIICLSFIRLGRNSMRGWSEKWFVDKRSIILEKFQ